MVGAVFIVIGFDPQAPLGVEPEAVRGREYIALDGADLVGGHVCRLWIPCQQKQFPLEGGGGRVIALFPPAQNMAVLIVPARVGAVDGLIVAAATLVVVGQGNVNLPVIRLHRHPFRTVHGGGAEQVGGAAGLDQHLGLVIKPVGFGERPFPENQRLPLPFAPVSEHSHIEGAVIEQVTIGLPVIRLIAAGGHKLVEVFTPGVVTEVKCHAPVRPHGGGGTFTDQPAHGGAFYRRAIRVEGVDFHHPAETIGFIHMAAMGLLRVGGGIKTRVHGFPGKVFAVVALAEPITLVGHPLPVVVPVPVDEIVGPVFLAGEVGAPGGKAHGAVGDGAEHGSACGIADRLQGVGTSGRAAQGHGRHAGNTAIVARVHHPLPLAILALAHFDHADTMSGLFLFDLCLWALPPTVSIPGKGRSLRVKKSKRHLFMVNHQQAMLIGGMVKRKEMHAVVVVAGLLQLVSPVVGGITAPGRCPHPDRITPGKQYPGGVALRYGDPVKRHVRLHRQRGKPDGRHGRF